METIKEWAWCIISPAHAKNTWLRVTQKQEDRYYEVMKKVVIYLWIATALAGMFAAYRFGEYMQTKRLIQQQGYRQVIELPVQTN